MFEPWTYFYGLDADKFKVMNKKSIGFSQILGGATTRLFVTALIIAGFWKGQDLFLPGLSYGLALALSLSVVVVAIFFWGYWLSNWIKKLVTFTTQENRNEEELIKKIALLEQRIVELKGENNILKESGAAQTGNMPSNVTPIQTKSGDPKQSIIIQQRMFLHDLASKLQVLQSASKSAITLTKTINHKDQEALLNHLEMISRNVEKSLELHKQNRDFLIIAS
jgi:membrane protein implicated in regulation of membrane protease activity